MSYLSDKPEERIRIANRMCDFYRMLLLNGIRPENYFNRLRLNEFDDDFKLIFQKFIDKEYPTEECFAEFKNLV